MESFKQKSTGIVFSILGMAAFSTVWAAAEPAKKLKLEKLSFSAPANVKAFNVNGEAKSLEGEALITSNAVEKLTVTVPVSALTTNMSMRDKHMRERIFQTQDGKLPPVNLTAKSKECMPVQSPKESPKQLCTLEGVLEIQGTARPFSMKLDIERTGNKVTGSGKGVVKLSDYGIPQPEQLGIKVSNEVEIDVRVAAE